MDILEFDGIVYNTDTIIEDAKKLETVEKQIMYVKKEINKIDKFDQYDLCDYSNFEEGDPVAKRLHNSFIDFIKDRRNFIKELSSELEILKGSNKKKDNVIPLKVQALVNYYTQNDIFELTLKGKQHFNSYFKKLGRTGDTESERKNSAHKIILEQTIAYLESHNYTDAVIKAKKEFEEFENNLA